MVFPEKSLLYFYHYVFRYEISAIVVLVVSVWCFIRRISRFAGQPGSPVSDRDEDGYRLGRLEVAACQSKCKDHE